MDGVHIHWQRLNEKTLRHGLNPCCNGWCTHTLSGDTETEKKAVLILVVMDGVHILMPSLPGKGATEKVLILVVMDGVHILCVVTSTKKTTKS